VVVWTIPVIIVIGLAILAWETTHKLDPYRPLESDKAPIKVDVVALNWKWLFIYPDLGIATVNQLAFPKDTPVNFRITSDVAMNSFFIPQLGGQIYAMAGMETKLHLLANEAGSYDGMSANYSGAGFSGMKFKAIATEPPRTSRPGWPRSRPRPRRWMPRPTWRWPSRARTTRRPTSPPRSRVCSTP
jgi:cytochrome o ubiquinol oxidase subunit 2